MTNGPGEYAEVTDPNIEGLQVLQLTTSEEIFFKQQIDVLEGLGIDCTVLSVPGAEQVDGDNRTNRGATEYLRFLPRVRRELRRGEFDLIHANYGLTAPYAVIQRRLPVLLTLWGSDVIGRDGLITRAFAWRADAITVRSSEMRERLGRDDAHIVPSGVDLDLFRPIDRRLAQTHVNWADDERHVLFPYSPTYAGKRYPLAEQVVSDVQRDFDRPVRLQTLSGVAHHEMPFYYNAADVVLMTSRHEGSPNTVKEALACNVPVVSTDVGDVRERLNGVSPGGVGTSRHELTELIVEVLDSRCRCNGRDSVTEIGWDTIGQRFIDIYQTILR